VELKADWPEPKKAARRLAGHANASRGPYVLWLIGVDETSGVNAALTPIDGAQWYPQVAAEFDGVPPGVHDLIVPTPSGPVTALLFDTARPPYVVKNPAFGSERGEFVALEVPWREGTRVRSATRSELLRLLVPLAETPDVEVLRCAVALGDEPAREDKYGEHLEAEQLQPHLSWNVSLRLYITPRSQQLLVLPIHRTSLTLRAGDVERRLRHVRYSVPYIHFGSGLRADSHTISSTNSEALLSGPGVLEVSGSLFEPPWEYSALGDLVVEYEVIPAGMDEVISVAPLLKPAEPVHRTPTHARSWETVESGA
jgi:hypothetical protein